MTSSYHPLDITGDIDGLITEMRERFEQERNAEQKQACGQMLVSLGFLKWQQHFLQELERQGVAPEDALSLLQRAEQDERDCPIPLPFVPKVKALLTQVLGVSFN